MAGFQFFRTRSPLAIRLLLTILLSSTLITCVIISIQLYLEYRNDIQLIRHRLEQVRISYSDSIAISVWNFDRKQYRSQLDGILHFQDIVYAEIRSPEGEPIVTRGTLPHAGFIREAFQLRTTDFDRPVAPGTLVIYASLERVYDNLVKRGLVIMLTQGIKTLVVSIVILLAFNWMITRHLYRIADFTRRIDLDTDDRLHIDRHLKRPDELDDIIYAINDMKEKIRGNYRTIAELNKNLEQTVMERTQELSESNDKLRYLFHNTLETILIFRNRRCVDINDAGIALFGFPSQEAAMGLQPQDFVAPEAVETVTRKLAEPNPEPYETKGRRWDGTSFPVLVKGQTAHIAGEPLRITSVIDLTQVKETERELLHANEELKKLSSTDPLTGAYNRRFFAGAAERILALGIRNGQQTSLAVIDIDDFKIINDRFGHDVGDQALQCLVDLIRKNTRDSDLIARFGGEEFVVLLPNTPIADARKVIENIRLRVAETPLAAGSRFTISIGLAAVKPKQQEITDALKRADRALYRAKREGKNRICMA